MSDKVEVFDFEKYNFVTPIMKPDAMDRGELLDRVMNNYRRFYMQQGAVLLSLGGHRAAAALSARLPEGVPEVRLRAQVLRSRQGRLLGAAVEKEGRLPFRRRIARSRRRTADDWKANAERSRKARRRAGEPVMACGGGEEQMAENEEIDAIPSG